MRPLAKSLTMILLATLVCACDQQAKSPRTVAKDTAEAEERANKNISQTEANAESKVEDANATVSKDTADAHHTAAVEDEKVADAKAKGNYETASARCEALSGSDQVACKDQAKAAYDTAVAQARQAKVETDPQH
jgi:hypothetical protein